MVLIYLLIQCITLIGLYILKKWMKHKLESRLLGEISITSDMQMAYNLKDRRTKERLDESERGE